MKVVVRGATPADTEGALAVVHQSITLLCAADHQNDTAALERWLANKTPEHFARWLADPDCNLLVAELDGHVRGLGQIGRTGKIYLCYVQPGFERKGVGGALLGALEARAHAWGLPEVSLDSTAEARPFYECHGYESTGDPVCGCGSVRCYPFKKAL